MNLFRMWWADEPARFWSALVILLNSVIALVVAMGWITLDTTQLALVYLVVLNLAVVVAGEGVRARVSPTGQDPVEDDDA